MKDVQALQQVNPPPGNSQSVVTSYTCNDGVQVISFTVPSAANGITSVMSVDLKLAGLWQPSFRIIGFMHQVYYQDLTNAISTVADALVDIGGLDLGTINSIAFGVLSGGLPVGDQQLHLSTMDCSYPNPITPLSCSGGILNYSFIAVKGLTGAYPASYLHTFKANIYYIV